MGQTYTSKELIRLVTAAGWVKARQTGSHVQFRHPERSGLVTIPHPKPDLPPGTVHSILKQAGLK